MNGIMEMEGSFSLRPIFQFCIKSWNSLQSWDFSIDLLRLVWSGLSSSTLIPSLSWMNFQVSVSVFSSVFFFKGKVSIIYIWLFLLRSVKFYNTAVTAPAGFPDHPHRGLKLTFFFLFLCHSYLFFRNMLCCELYWFHANSFWWFPSTGFETVTYMLQVAQIMFVSIHMLLLLPMLYFPNGKQVKQLIVPL